MLLYLFKVFTQERLDKNVKMVYNRGMEDVSRKCVLSEMCHRYATLERTPSGNTNQDVRRVRHYADRKTGTIL